VLIAVVWISLQTQKFMYLIGKGNILKTLQLDSPIRKFCVDPNDQRLIAIIRDPNKGQRIIQYNLDASL